jgi:hypothetical protein
MQCYDWCLTARLSFSVLELCCSADLRHQFIRSVSLEGSLVKKLGLDSKIKLKSYSLTGSCGVMSYNLILFIFINKMPK